MSHILDTPTSIVIAGLDQPEQRAAQMNILCEAVNRLIVKYGGQLTDGYFDFGYHPHKTNLALGLVIGSRFDRDALLPRGIGCQVRDDGTLFLNGDSWGHEGFYHQITREIEHTYTVLAMQQALSQVCDGVNILSQEGLVADLVGGLYA